MGAGANNPSPNSQTTNNERGITMKVFKIAFINDNTGHCFWGYKQFKTVDDCNDWCWNLTWHKPNIFYRVNYFMYNL